MKGRMLLATEAMFALCIREGKREGGKFRRSTDIGKNKKILAAQ
jgi:hypothetical protein